MIARAVWQVVAPAGTQRWALAESEFGPGLVGAKAGNLALLR